MPEAENELIEIDASKLPALPEMARKLTHAQKWRMTRMVRIGITEAVDPEDLIPAIAKKLQIDEEVVTACFDTLSAYTREQLKERSRLLAGDKHFQRGLMVEQLERLFGAAFAVGDYKVALEAIKVSKDLLDLGVKRAKRAEGVGRKVTVQTTAVTKMTDAELEAAAQKRLNG